MESSPELSYQFNKTTRAWEKRYKIYDYIGNLRILANSSGTVLEKHSYTPYGEELKTSADLSKTTWLGKERDAESSLGDHGVRKYDWETGRFTGTDALWEKYYGWNPWQYSANNPVMNLDVNGKFKISPKDREKYKSFAYIIDIVMPALANNKNFMQAVSKYTGASIASIKRQLNSGSGAKIEFLYTSYFLGMTENSKLIYISQALADGLERGDEADYNPNLEEKFASMINLLAHEMVQVLTMGKDKFANTKNPGEEFEELFLGRHYHGPVEVMDDIDPLRAYQYEEFLQNLREKRKKEEIENGVDDENTQSK